jgi:transglycosylase-like protein with SLT domain
MARKVVASIVVAGMTAVALTAAPAAPAGDLQVDLPGGGQVTVPSVPTVPNVPVPTVDVPDVEVTPPPNIGPVTVPTAAPTSAPVVPGSTPAPGSSTTSPSAPASSGAPSSSEPSATSQPTGEENVAPGLDNALEQQGIDGERRSPLSSNPGRNADGSPTPENPAFTLALPGAAPLGVPNFFIDRFRIPPFLLPIYQAAGIEYGVRWEVLAAINEVETDYGRNLNVSSAGALGWMQFMPATWRAYGVDANQDGLKDPYNPVDAIFAAARYLKAAGAETDLRQAIFAYNHADWYVDMVLLRARMLGGLPSNFVSSLTGLTQGRFPVAARATYADDIAERERAARQQIVESSPTRRSIDVFADEGSRVIAVNDGVIRRVTGSSVVLEDVYGNSYTYSGLDVARTGHLLPDPGPATPPPVPAPEEPVKQRLFANPTRVEALDAGGAHQVGGLPEAHRSFASDDTGARSLRGDARIPAGTVLGRITTNASGMAPHLTFTIRPAGRGAPLIDPKPILDGWKLLETTAMYRAAGKNPFTEASPSIGQVLLMDKESLQRMVLSDPHVEVYGCGRDDIQAGRIDRRVLATLEFLSLSGFKPTVSSLRCGHSYLTASGNVSEHSSGNAVDISMINGIPILGHQGPGSIAEIVVERLTTLQGLMKPHQIISLMTIDGADNTFAMSDHDDHIHVGWAPLYGTNERRTRQLDASLQPDQWIKLVDRLGRIENPTVPSQPSSVATRASGAHRAD